MKEPMHKRLYKDTPSLARDTDSGKMNVKKGVTEGERESSEVNSGIAGIPIHATHINERREMHQRHVHEKMAMHHKHEVEHAHHDYGNHGNKKELHKKHEREMKEMHERHEHEAKKMHERHEKEYGNGEHLGHPKREELTGSEGKEKGGAKERSLSGKEHIKEKE